MKTRPILLAAFAALTVLATCGGLALARGGAQDVHRVAYPISPPWPEGGRGGAPPPANGRSDNVTFSQDNRRVRLLAYDSTATNLVPSDRNRRRDVFVMIRNRGAGKHSGKLVRASVGPRGREANGPSARPSLDGEVRAVPHCVAFESRATNLVRGDRSRDWDVYVRDLRARRTVLASPGRRTARRAVIDGGCASVTFEAAGAVWVRDLRRRRTHRIARGSDPDQQTNGEGVAYVRRGQVYHRSFRLGRRGIVLGRERLVSDDRGGRPGNGRSGDPAMDDQGHYVAFESRATNLCLRRCSGISRDRNGRTTDVFRRTLSRRAPTRDSMQMVSYSHRVRAQGNGPSYDPAMSGAGENVVFTSRATNLRQRDERYKRDANGRIPDVLSWTYPRRRGHGNVILQTGASCPVVLDCRAASVRPAMSSRGNYVAFTSSFKHLCDPGMPDGIRRDLCPLEVFLRYIGDSHEGHPLG